MDLMSFYALPPPVRPHKVEMNYIGGNFVYPGQHVYQGAQYQPKQHVYPQGICQVKLPFTFPQAVAPAKQEEKIDVVFERYMEEQRKITKNLCEKLDHVFTDLCSKFESLSTRVQKLGIHTVLTAEAVRKQNEVNPQTFCSAVLSEENQLALVPTLSQEGEKEADPEESQKPELFSGESRRAYTGAVIDFMKSRMSLGNIRKDVFYQKTDFKTAPRAVNPRPEKATLIPKKGAMLPKDAKKRKPHPKPKEVMKPSELKHDDVFKDIKSVLSTTLDEHGADEEPDGVPKSFSKMRILTSKDPDPKEAHTAKEKLMNTLKLFPRTFVFKDGIGDDLGVPRPPREPPEPENGEAKGIPNPLVELIHT